MIALALTLALFVQQVQTERLEAPWQHVEILGWIPVGATADADYYMLVRTGPDRSKLWVRYERRRGGAGGPLSQRHLVELDCDARRTRLIQSASFSDSNMTGTSNTANGPSPWEYAAPDTMSDAQLTVGCP